MAVLQATSITGGLTMHGMAAGFMKVDASGSVTMDTNTYATTSALSSYLALTGGTITGAVTITTSNDGALTLRVPSGDSNQWNYINFTGSDGVRDAYFGTNGSGDPQWWRDDNSLRITLGSVATINDVQIVTNSGTWGINITGNADTVDGYHASSFALASNFTGQYLHLGAGVSYNNDRTTKTSGGLAIYSGYSGGANRPTTYDISAQFSVNGNMGMEIAADWISTAGPTLFARSLRDCCQNWSSWVTLLTSINYNSYSPTLTGGGASGTWGISISGNSATTSQTNFSSLTVNSNTVLHAGNYNSYSPTLTGGGASGTWSINITGSAGSASSASSVPWTGVSSGTRTNYSLGFQPSSNGYAGFYFSKSTSGGTAEDAGYLLIRGTSDNDVYTAEGITLVADAGWLTLAQRTQSNKGVRIMTGSSSTTRIEIVSSGMTTVNSGLTVLSGLAWNNATPALNVGGSGDARIQVRHIWGKEAGTANPDHLWLQYTNSTFGVQIGASGGSNPLYVAGNIYMGGYFGGNLVATQSWVTSQGYITGSYLPLSGGTLSGTLTIGGAIGSYIWNDGSGTYIEAYGNSTATRKIRIQSANSGATAYAQWFVDGGNLQIYGAVSDNVNFLMNSSTVYLRYNGSDKFWTGSDGTRTQGWSYYQDASAGMHWPSNGWHLLPSNSADFRIHSGNASESSLRMETNGTTRGYFYTNSSNEIGILNSGRSWGFRMNSGLNAFIHGQTLTINADNAAWSSIYMNDGDHGMREIHCNSNRIGFLNQSGNWGAWNDDNGNWGMSLNAYMAGNRFDIQGAEGQISFKDGDNVWTGYVGFTGNLGYLSFPGRNVKINSGYNGTITLETGVSGYNDGVVSIPYGRLIVNNNYIYSGSYIEAGSDMRAPIFYDSNNTAYYGNFASTSVMNSITFGTSTTGATLSGNSDWGVRFSNSTGWVMIGPANGSYAHIYTDRGSFYMNVNDLYLNGNLVPIYGYNRGGDLYASRYYDANDTTYYVDPNSTSVLNSVIFNGILYTDNPADYWSTSITGLTNAPVSTRNFDVNVGTTARYVPLTHQTALYNSGYRTHVSTGIYKAASGWSAGWYMAIGGNDSYPTEAFYLNYGGSISHSNGYVTIEGSARSPIFYDSQDTNFYIDPNSYSRLYRLYIGGSAHNYEASEGVILMQNNQNNHNYLVSNGAGWGSWNQWIRYVAGVNTWRIGTYDDANNSGTSVWRLAGANRGGAGEINYVVAGPRGAWGSNDRVVLYNPYARYDNGDWQGSGSLFALATESWVTSQGYATGGPFVRNVLGDSGAYNLNTSGQQAFFRFSTGAWVNGPTTGNYSHVLSVNAASDNRTFQVYFGDVPGYLWWRPNQGGSWHGWERILTSYNYNSWAPTLTGGGASGTWSINITGGAGSANLASQVTINYNNDSNSTYQMLWGSGNSVYGTSLIYCNPSTDTIYSRALRGSDNVAGTGEATYHPAGIYSTSTNWLYGTMYLNGNTVYDADSFQLNGRYSIWGRWNTYSAYILKVAYMTFDYNSNNGHESYHSIASTDINGSYSDNVSLNSYNDITLRLDANNNNSNSYLRISNNSAGDGTIAWIGYESGMNQNYFSGSVGISTGPRTDGYRLNMGGSIHLNGNSVDYVGSLYFSGAGHIQPNSGSYGALQMTSSKNGWSGIRFTDSNVNLMVNSNESGFHNNSYGWQMRWENGTIYCHKNSYGGGTSATVWDSSNASRAGNTHLMYYQGFTLDANTMDPNATGFTYSVNAPTTGPVARFSTGGGYDLWLNAAYSGSGTLIYFRTRNGDAGTNNSWRRILNDGYDPYAANMNQYVRTTDSVTFATVSANDVYTTGGWFRNHTNNNGIYWSGTGWHIYPADSANMRFRADSSSTAALRLETTGGNVRGYFYANSSNEVGILNSGGGWAFRMNNSLNGFIHGNQLTINADNAAWSSIYMNDGDEGMREIHCNSNRIGFLTQSGNWGAYLDDGNNWFADGSMRSPYFYDSNNTGYYGVFSGTSRMYRIDANYLYSYDWVYAQGDIIAYYSDERLKTKVGGIENALDKIKQLNGFYYVNNELANSFGYTDTKVQVGLSAQEVKAVLPEVVTLAAFDTEFDENQKPIGSKSGEDYLTVNYDKLVPLLIEAIKEQQKQIDELKARLN